MKVWILVNGYWDDGDIKIFSSKDRALGYKSASEGDWGDPHEYEVD